MNNTYFLMRHGHSIANQQDLIISLPEVGCHQYGLTTLGREQVQRSIEQSDLGSNILILSSDFLRTQETANLVKMGLGCPHDIVLEKGLRERNFGNLEGASGDRYKEVWAQDSLDVDHQTYQAESPRELALRLQNTLTRLEETYQGRRILLVSHGDTLRFLQLVAAGRDLRDHLQIRLFEAAEIRELGHLPACETPC